jgi:hypothetical protein
MTSDSARQAGDLTDVVITDAMVSAGLAEYWRRDVEDVGSRDVVCRVYRFMEAARLAEGVNNLPSFRQKPVDAIKYVHTTEGRWFLEG